MVYVIIHCFSVRELLQKIKQREVDKLNFNSQFSNNSSHKIKDRIFVNTIHLLTRSSLDPLTA